MLSSWFFIPLFAGNLGRDLVSERSILICLGGGLILIAFIIRSNVVKRKTEDSHR